MQPGAGRRRERSPGRSRLPISSPSRYTRIQRPSNVAAQWCQRPSRTRSGVILASHSTYPPMFSPSDRIVPSFWNENSTRSSPSSLRKISR